VNRPPVRRGPGLVVIAAAVAVLIAAASAAYAVIRARQHEAAGLRTSGIPGSVSTSLANLMQLSPVPVTSAPRFTLTDQGGHPMSLAGLRGRVVVLDFVDPHCTDICPIVSREFLDAYRDLGATAAGGVPGGERQPLPPAGGGRGGVLRQAAADHDPGVALPDRVLSEPAGRVAGLPDRRRRAGPGRGCDPFLADVLHRPAEPGALADPMADHTASGSSYLPADQLASWGQGIALMARQLAG